MSPKSRKLQKVNNRIMPLNVFILGLALVFLVECRCPDASRYIICTMDSLHSTSSFTFIPYGDITQRCTVHGIEFAWKDLKRKLSTYLNDVSPIRAWGGNYHYYLNVDRCAYGGLLKLSANVKGLCGPYIFAVNNNCTAVYYHQDAPHAGWKRYQSVRYYPELQRLLICKSY
ncbi:unnamed protein product [Porites lobata]|uniref:Uncharacterized protein n=1 Tax=Porites lobata TaxID=104759 RepID=A0ABN8P671_9CNID|nr:unnamed protein product [Porites lobata]